MAGYTALSYGFAVLDMHPAIAGAETEDAGAACVVRARPQRTFVRSMDSAGNHGGTVR